MKAYKKYKNLDFDHLFQRVYELLIPEKSFYITTVIYGLGVGILTLAIPISVQSLVNTISFGVLTQPLIVLSIVLLVLLIFSASLKVLQVYIVEIFQRRVYARISTKIGHALLNADPMTFRSVNGTELTNRYFDIMTLQKGLKVLLMDAFAMFLQIVVGLLLLAFYHPYFLIFDVLLIFFIWLVWVLYAKKAIQTAISESDAKYEVLHWLEEIARENFFFKTFTRWNYASLKTDDKIIHYIDVRKKHFRYLLSQHIFLMLIYAIMSALILGLGGFLVTKGELTLGQLVAAELIITLILASLAKSGKYLESFYDLIAGVKKLTQILDLPEEDTQMGENLEIESGDLKLRQVTYKSTQYKFHFDLEFKHGKNYMIAHQFHSSKSIFLDLIRAIHQYDTGDILLDKKSYSTINKLTIRDNIYIVEEPIIFAGSIWDNLTSCIKHADIQQVAEVLEVVDLDNIIDVFPEGLNTQMTMSGHPLWRSQLIRLEIARAIIMKPKVLVLTEIIDQISNDRQKKILDYIGKLDITVLVFSNKLNSEENFEKVTLESKTSEIVSDNEKEF